MGDTLYLVVGIKNGHVETLPGGPDHNLATSKEHFLGQNFANEQKATKNVQQNNKVIATKHKPSCQK